MTIACSVLGKDVTIADDIIPVISPYYRLKRSGDWSLLCRYEPEQIAYSKLSPLVGATLALMDGRLTFRHLSLVVQYAHDLETLEKSKDFVTEVIKAVNKENDAVVQMSDAIAPFLRRVDPLEYVHSPSEGALQKRPVSPLSLNLMFSNDCQTNCQYCYATRRKVPHGTELSRSRWIELFHEAHDLGIDTVTLSGGDPLYRADALDLLEELIKLDMLFLLSTKCHVTPEMADKLAAIGMTKPVNQYTREIQISMDGPDEQTADVLAGSPGYFRRTLDSIGNLAGRGFNLRVKAVVTPLNAPRVYQWIKMLVEMGVQNVSVAAYNRTFYRHKDELFLSREDRVAIAEQCRRAKAEFPELELRLTGLEWGPASAGAAEVVTAARTESAAAPEPSKAERWQERAQCSGGRSTMTITPDGKVVLCDTVPQEGVFVVGDVTHQSLQEVWNGQELVAFAYPPRERFTGSACYECQEFEECQTKAGYCFRDSYFNYGSVFAPPPKCPHAPNDGMRME